MNSIIVGTALVGVLMGSYRDRLQIIADILTVVSKEARKTQIMYQANLSYRLLCRYLDEVTKTGLIVLQDTDRYVLSEKGKEYLDKHEEYSKRRENLEKQRFSADDARLSLERLIPRQRGNNGSHHGASDKPIFTKTVLKTTKGVILAAGDGSRIRKITYGGFPKELLPIGSVPAIRFPIEALRSAGVDDVIIVIAPQTKHGIVDGLQSGERLGVNFSYVVQERNEKSPVGMGPAVLSARGMLLPDEDFIVACGDSILCDSNSSKPFDCLKPLIEIHKKTNAIATTLVYPTETDPTRFGVVKFRSFREEKGRVYGELESLIEKPSLRVAKKLRSHGRNFIAVGYYVFKPQIFSYIEKTKPGARNEVHITDAMALALKDGKKVLAVVHGRKDGKEIIPYEYWDVGIPEDYMYANKCLSNMNLEELVD
jgi:dTDP-glucose pyrophosphorylase/predicted transcriptional regulator